MRKILLILTLSLLPIASLGAEPELYGTYRLVSSTRQLLDSGQVVDTFGKNPKGLIMYGKDGHFLVLITSEGRPKPQSVEAMTDQQRADLHRMMAAYGGTYSFDGEKVEHHIDLSWNEVWTGTTVIRDVQSDGGRLIYTTWPAPFPGDAKMSVITLIWEKVK
jgi:hypothetical protein